MASTDKIDVFTQALRTEFIRGYDGVAEQPPIERAMTIVPSNGRIENYAWMTPTPGISQWQGYRRYGEIGETNYRVPNLTFSGGFQILKEDFDDDQTGGYKLKAAELGRRGKEFSTISVQQTLALGQTTPCFDGTNLFASTHTTGLYPTGGNIITATTALSDATHAMICLVITGMVKPLLWQNREPPKLLTDLGEKYAEERRAYRSWCDLRGAAAFGYWWDTLLVKFTGTPTVAEMQTALGQVNARFRQFKYPKNLSNDPDEYIHSQIKFTDKTLMIVNSTGIDHIIRQALTLSLIGSTENIYKGFADQVTSGYLDNLT